MRICAYSGVNIQCSILTERKAGKGPYYRFMRLFQPMLPRKADYLHLQGSVGVLHTSSLL